MCLLLIELCNPLLRPFSFHTLYIFLLLVLFPILVLEQSQISSSHFLRLLLLAVLALPDMLLSVIHTPVVLFISLELSPNYVHVQEFLLLFA